MARYTYKYVRDRLPEFVTASIEGYEGAVNYDGDQWQAAADYIDLLEDELEKQYAQTGVMHSAQLLDWLTHRTPTTFCRAGWRIREEERNAD